MNTEDNTYQPPEFPTEVTFKVICKNNDGMRDAIEEKCGSHKIEVNIDHRESRKGNFISYTVSGHFPDEQTLQGLCGDIAAVDGVMSIF